jgi:basic membrane lipoprotein Med (substrate-binding protein (PBP1-ABC) superfamily)
MLLTACAKATPAPEEAEEAAAPKMKACFIYVGPIGDYGM